MDGIKRSIISIRMPFARRPQIAFAIKIQGRKVSSMQRNDNYNNVPVKKERSQDSARNYYWDQRYIRYNFLSRFHISSAYLKNA